jgi:hypothetical protein
MVATFLGYLLDYAIDMAPPDLIKVIDNSSAPPLLKRPMKWSSRWHIARHLYVIAVVTCLDRGIRLKLRLRRISFVYKPATTRDLQRRALRHRAASTSEGLLKKLIVSVES